MRTESFFIINSVRFDRNINRLSYSLHIFQECNYCKEIVKPVKYKFVEFNAKLLIIVIYLKAMYCLICTWYTIIEQRNSAFLSI